MSELDPGFVSDAMRALFCPEARARNLLRVEAALARSQAHLGLVPSESARAITSACDALHVDANTLLRRGWELGTPVLALLEQLEPTLAPEHARHLHQGATSQDIVDSACALELRAGLRQLHQTLAQSATALCSLAEQHRGTPYCARTLLQRAQRSVFGLTAARWLLPLAAAGVELQRAQQTLPVQLGGAVGDLAAFARRGIECQERLAAELGLAVPLLPWHSDRAPVQQALYAASASTRAVLQVANDLVLLSQGDVGELHMRAGKSSRMPHKQNPIDAVRAVAAAEASLRMAAAMSAGRAHELERAAGGWQMEWLLVPLVFYSSGAAHEALAAALSGLRVDTDRMRATAEAVGGEPDHTTAQTLIDRALVAAATSFGASP